MSYIQKWYGVNKSQKGKRDCWSNRMQLFGGDLNSGITPTVWRQVMTQHRITSR